MAHGLYITIARVVTGRLLHGSAESHFQGNDGAFHITLSNEGTAESGLGNTDNVAVDGRGKHLVGGLAIHSEQHQ